jgi:AhpD family alkylhydroperoxidase
MRIEYSKIAPDGYKSVFSLVRYHESESTIEAPLRHLVELRASQINGCAFCLAMHAKQLRDGGETQFRLDVLSAWEETDLFTPREKAALAWTEAVTLVADTHVPDEVYELARSEFSERELVDLTLVIGTINLWNRLAIPFRSNPVG